MHRVLLLLIFVAVTIALRAQVLVKDEPRHHPVFENNRIRILNVQLPPGDTTQYHKHAQPSVFLCFTQTATTGQLWGKEPVASTSSVGYMWFENLAPPHSKVHRDWNDDSVTFHVMDIELLQAKKLFSRKQTPILELPVAIDTPWARTYKLSVAPNTLYTLPKKHAPALVVSVLATQLKVDGRLQATPPGTYFWVPAGKPFSISNAENSTAHLAVIELPE